MKTIVGLVVMVTVLLGAMAGCNTTPSETVYRDVSVGPMTISIPDDWQRPEDYDEFTEEFLASFTEEEKQAVQFDAYGDESENAYFMPMTIDMVLSFELVDLVWRGWDIELETMNLSTEDFVESVQGGLLAELTEVSQETHLPLTIGGYEAWEMMHSANLEGEPVRVGFLLIFATDDMGVLLMIVKQDKWLEYEDVWDTVRDSVQFSY